MGAMRIFILIAGSFGDREFVRSASPTFDYKIAVTPPRPIDQLCAAKNGTPTAPVIFFVVEFESYFDVRSVGVAEDMWRESSSIIRFESAVRAAKILRWSVASRDALRPRPARYAPPTHRGLSWEPATLISPSMKINGNKRI
jgi:hypothetical protein